MYVVDNKLYLHMIKTAGISVHKACNIAGHNFDFNMRHISYEMIPERYKSLDTYALIREPVSWYESFYNFYVNVEGFFSWLLNDLADDGYIYPISIDEFVSRAMNMKSVLKKYPNKARVFNNILQTQGASHFLNSYFERSFSADDEDSLEQFNCSLYDFFYNKSGLDNAKNIPMSNISDIEKIFNIKMPHENKTNKDKLERCNNKSKKIIQKTHKKYYDIIDNYKPMTLKVTRVVEQVIPKENYTDEIFYELGQRVTYNIEKK